MKLNILDRFSENTPQPSRAMQARNEPMEISLTDKAASVFSWAISAIALFVSAACVLIAVFRKRDSNA
jgi:hypothetical protein